MITFLLVTGFAVASAFVSNLLTTRIMMRRIREMSVGMSERISSEMEKMPKITEDHVIFEHVIAQSVAAQSVFEQTHPVKYDMALRRTAVSQRVEKLLHEQGLQLPDNVRERVAKVVF